MFAGEDAFRFRHVLIRNAAYDGLPKQIRAELHERFADWLVGRGRRPRRQRSRRCSATTSSRRSGTARRSRASTRRAMSLAARGGQLLASAGRRAVARGDAPAAVNLLERAGALLPEDAPERLELRLELADALHEPAISSAWASCLESALAHAEVAGNVGRRGPRTARAGVAAPLHRPRHGGSRRHARRRRSMPPRSSSGIGDDAGLARSLRRIADVYWLRCRVEPGEPLLERALEHALRAGDEREVSEIRQALIRGAAVGPMPVDAAIARCEEIIARLGARSAHRGGGGERARLPQRHGRSLRRSA